MNLLENKNIIILYALLIFQACISCNQNSNKGAPDLIGETIFLNYNEHLNYVSIDSLHVITPKGTFEKMVGGMVFVNDTLIDFNYLGIYQCSGCEFLTMSFREGNLIENFSPNIQETILRSINEDNIKDNLLFMVKIKMLDTNFKITNIRVTDSTKIILRRINLRL